ncbi:uncharacterized protein LOC106873565 [Octopus bimaculoides]|uniref:Uncharacterized protein n=1 Tax=Octopus bimaculoides TaxID=37653 RepID=A0A0L8H0L0_OCTBM|nr:uncharacterized protein LOC106873565 [Octopus bimaculoides]|eukprot:XP_014776479.1 PREDICTED: uncharacterized protein LOC106873565 [Octopus bimaculoides]
MEGNVNKTGQEALVAPNEKPWEKKRRLARLAEYKGSQYPPFSIEPMPHERQRLDGKGMTDADRQLRKQWLLDQNLSPNEPRYVPEVHPRNVFKRIGSMPFEALYKVLKPIIGVKPALVVRRSSPWILGIYGTLCTSYYFLKYQPNDWKKTSGFYVRCVQPQYTMGMAKPFPEKEASDYYDKGFKSRQVLLNAKTSYIE